MITIKLILKSIALILSFIILQSGCVWKNIGMNSHLAEINRNKKELKREYSIELLQPLNSTIKIKVYTNVKYGFETEYIKILRTKQARATIPTIIEDLLFQVVPCSELFMYTELFLDEDALGPLSIALSTLNKYLYLLGELAMFNCYIGIHYRKKKYFIENVIKNSDLSGTNYQMLECPGEDCPIEKIVDKNIGTVTLIMDPTHEKIPVNNRTVTAYINDSIKLNIPININGIAQLDIGQNLFSQINSEAIPVRFEYKNATLVLNVPKKLLIKEDSQQSKPDIKTETEQSSNIQQLSKQIATSSINGSDEKQHNEQKKQNIPKKTDSLETHKAVPGKNNPCPKWNNNLKLIQKEEFCLMQTIKDWANAWSSKDASRYLSVYSVNFKPKGNIKRSSWEKRRKLKLKKKYIKIKVLNLKVQFNSCNLGIVTFEQHYKSDRYSDKTIKQLTFEKNDNNWKITSEKTLKKLK